MNNDLSRLLKWFCSKLTYNDLSSAVPMLLEILNGTRSDIPLKPDEKPQHYRDFRVDTDPPLTNDPSPPDEQASRPWKDLLAAYKRKRGKPLAPIKHGDERVPAGCRCAHCHAPRKYLYINNGKLASQVRCKVCAKTSPTHGCRRRSKASYWCPHCECALFRWKHSTGCTIYKCPNDKCSHYLRKKGGLTGQEAQMRTQQKYDPNFKLRYQYREYHIDPKDLKTARPGNSPAVNLHKIHNNYHVVGLVLTFMINLGLSSRVTRNALKGLFDISSRRSGTTPGSSSIPRKRPSAATTSPIAAVRNPRSPCSTMRTAHQRKGLPTRPNSSPTDSPPTTMPSWPITLRCQKHRMASPRRPSSG